MSERLPYEEHLQQQWNDLPLPDENMAWEDMKRRLEEDDDDGVIVWWRRGCLLWGLLLIVVFGLGIWFIKKEKWFIGSSQKTETVTEKKDDSVSRQKINSGTTVTLTETPDEAKRIKENKENVPGEEGKVQKEPTTIQGPETGEGKGDNSINKTEGDTNKDATIKTPGRTNKTKKNTELVPSKQDQTGNTIKRKPVVQKGTVNVPSRVRRGQSGIKKPVTGKEVVTDNSKKNNNEMPVLIPVDKPVTIISDDSVSKKKDAPATINNDSVVKKQPDSTKKKPGIKESSLSSNEAKKDSSKKKPVFFSAGIAMQQLLPVAGQKSVPYNSLGRKGTLADYIPSLYFRVNKKDKWFVQGEFRYGAPQYAKNIVYNQQVKLDTVGTNNYTTKSSNTLKKTYYHQLPVTFNYFVLPDWSVGAGLSWNKFVSAISDREVISTNNATSVDSLVTKGIVRNKKDSSFAKSYFQGVFETQYKWKRFSIGARYAFGLQPYIKFTLITGEQREDRNSSLQVFLRYQLWKSKEEK